MVSYLSYFIWNPFRPMFQCDCAIRILDFVHGFKIITVQPVIIPPATIQSQNYVAWRSLDEQS